MRSIKSINENLIKTLLFGTWLLLEMFVPERQHQELLIEKFHVQFALFSYVSHEKLLLFCCFV